MALAIKFDLEENDLARFRTPFQEAQLRARKAERGWILPAVRELVHKESRERPARLRPPMAGTLGPARRWWKTMPGACRRNSATGSWMRSPTSLSKEDWLADRRATLHSRMRGRRMADPGGLAYDHVVR